MARRVSVFEAARRSRNAWGYISIHKSFGPSSALCRSSYSIELPPECATFCSPLLLAVKVQFQVPLTGDTQRLAGFASPLPSEDTFGLVSLDASNRIGRSAHWTPNAWHGFQTFRAELLSPDSYYCSGRKIVAGVSLHSTLPSGRATR